MERLAFRALSSRLDNFSGSICFMSTEAEDEEEEGAEKTRQSETDWTVKLDSNPELEQQSFSTAIISLIGWMTQFQRLT